jgi:hypothetical protein
LVTKQAVGSIVYALLALVSFTIALLAYFEVILYGDTTGRYIYTILWSLVGLGWLGRLVIWRKRRR